MLLQAMMHERDTILTAFVVSWQTFALVLEPFDLVPSDAVHSTSTHAVSTTCAEEPEAGVSDI